MSSLIKTGQISSVICCPNSLVVLSIQSLHSLLSLYLHFFSVSRMVNKHVKLYYLLHTTSPLILIQCKTTISICVFWQENVQLYYWHKNLLTPRRSKSSAPCVPFILRICMSDNCRPKNMIKLSRVGVLRWRSLFPWQSMRIIPRCKRAKQFVLKFGLLVSVLKLIWCYYQCWKNLNQ